MTKMTKQKAHGGELSLAQTRSESSEAEEKANV